MEEQKDGWKDGRNDGQTLFHRTLLANAGSPKINYTYVTKKWKYDVNDISYSEKFLVPLGIMTSLIELWRSPKCYHSYNVLPINVRVNLNVSADNYHAKKKMTLHLSHEGDKGVKEFTYVYCNICQTQVNGMIRKYNDSHQSSLNVEDLISNRDVYCLFQASCLI